VPPVITSSGKNGRRHKQT